MPSFDSYCDCGVSNRQDTIPVSTTPLSDELFDNNGTDNSHYDVTMKTGKLRNNRVHEQNSRTIERLHFKMTRTCFHEIVIYVCTHLYRNTKHFPVIKSFISLHDRKGECFHTSKYDSRHKHVRKPSVSNNTNFVLLFQCLYHICGHLSLLGITFNWVNKQWRNFSLLWPHSLLHTKL